MTDSLPSVYVVRHGDTEWSTLGRYTGLTDAPLNALGEHRAQALAARLPTPPTRRVLTSPLRRAARTCELAGCGAHVVVDPDLVEWDYGDFEGLTTQEILARRPGWRLFRDGCPGGESPADVLARADRVIGRIRAGNEDTTLFSSGHFLRTLATRWIGVDITVANCLLLDPASISILGYNHELDDPAIALWNDGGQDAVTRP
jgi:probable phosphoglycerate mutase